MRRLLEPMVLVLGCVFAHRPAFPNWIAPMLLMFIRGGPDVLMAQAPPVPAASNTPAKASAPAAASSPPATATAKPPPSAAELQGAAIALQRAAIRKQADDLGLWLMPLDSKQPAETAEPPACDPLADSLVDPLIEDAARQQGLDPKLLRAMIELESAFRACAVSAKGAQGLMQLMPETAAELGLANPFDPRQNVDGGARYLKQLLDKYKGDLPKALGAYNAGSKTVDESGGVPDLQETRQYVDAILANAGLKPAETPANPAHPPTALADPAPTTGGPPGRPIDPPAKPADASAKPPHPPSK